MTEESSNTMNVEQQQEAQPTVQTETIKEINNGKYQPSKLLTDHNFLSDTVSKPLIKKVDERFIGRPVSGKPWKKVNKT